MPVEKKPIAILGAGAVGSILAANFAKIGQNLLLIESNEKRCQQIEAQGICIVGKDNVTTRSIKILRSLEELKPYRPEAIFICTKTWALKSLLPQLVNVIHPETLVVSFQNGIGPEDEISEFFPAEQVARGIVNYAGGISPDTGEVTQAWFNPPNFIGSLGEGTSTRVEKLADSLSRADFPTVALPSHETKKRVFFKTILNSALNALCASSGITMRQAMSYQHTRSLARILIREGLSVASSVGYNYGETAMDTCMQYLDEGGDHLPSMWTDLQRGAPTEIEHINGKIVKIGLMFKNIDVDANIFFTSMIITQEIKSGVRKQSEIPGYLTHI